MKSLVYRLGCMLKCQPCFVEPFMGSKLFFKVKGPGPFSFKSWMSASLLGRSYFFSEHFKQLSITALYLFNCLCLHSCEKISPKAVSDAEYFGAPKGISCLRKVLSCQNVLHDGFIAFDHWSLDSLPNMDNNFSLQLFHKTNQTHLTSYVQ